MAGLLLSLAENPPKWAENGPGIDANGLGGSVGRAHRHCGFAEPFFSMIAVYPFTLIPFLPVYLCDKLSTG